MSNASVLEWNNPELKRFIECLKRLSPSIRRHFLDQLYITGLIDLTGCPIDTRKYVNGKDNPNFGRIFKYQKDDNPSKRM